MVPEGKGNGEEYIRSLGLTDIHLKGGHCRFAAAAWSLTWRPCPEWRRVCGGYGSEDRLPHRLLYTGCPRCPRPAEHLRLPGMSALIPCASPSMPGAEEQTPEVAHIAGSRSSSRGTTQEQDEGPGASLLLGSRSPWNVL